MAERLNYVSESRAVLYRLEAKKQIYYMCFLSSVLPWLATAGPFWINPLKAKVLCNSSLHSFIMTGILQTVSTPFSQEATFD